MDHLLARSATEGVGKFRHIAYHVVYSIPPEGVALRHHRGAGCFRAKVAAPDVGVGEEKILQFGVAVLGSLVDIFALGLERVLQAGESDVNAAIVGSIFSGGKLAVLFYPGLGNVLSVFIGDAFVALGRSWWRRRRSTSLSSCRPRRTYGPGRRNRG
jgi:hypothetical protein